MNLQFSPVVIASGASLSPEVDLGNFTLAGVIMPSGWDAANLTLQAKTANGTATNVYDDSGSEVSITAAASRYILFWPALDLTGLRHIKVRSGTAATPVNQTADRTLTLILREF